MGVVVLVGHGVAAWSALIGIVAHWFSMSETWQPDGKLLLDLMEGLEQLVTSRLQRRSLACIVCRFTTACYLASECAKTSITVLFVKLITI
jgi:hypothetical protein